LFSIFDHQERLTSKQKGINKLNMVIDWELFRKELESLVGCDERDPRLGGRPPFGAVLMPKVFYCQRLQAQ
jgi:hypothetical protein